MSERRGRSQGDAPTAKELGQLLEELAIEFDPALPHRKEAHCLRPADERQRERSRLG